MQNPLEPPTVTGLLAEGFKRLLRPPFSILATLSLLIWAVSRTITAEDSTGLTSLFLLTIVTAYLNIALILAAADPDGDRSTDRWLRAAFARRTFWRFAFTELTAILLVILGAIALVIPAFIVGAAVAISAQSAVLEHHLPLDAVRRSIELTRGSRRPVGIVFGLFILLPLLVAQAGYQFGWPDDVDILWMAFEGVSVILEAVAVIALTRAFVQLGGVIEPVRERP